MQSKYQVFPHQSSNFDTINDANISYVTYIISLWHFVANLDLKSNVRWTLLILDKWHSYYHILKVLRSMIYKVLNIQCTLYICHCYEIFHAYSCMICEYTYLVANKITGTNGTRENHHSHFVDKCLIIIFSCFKVEHIRGIWSNFVFICIYMQTLNSRFFFV